MTSSPSWVGSLPPVSPCIYSLRMGHPTTDNGDVLRRMESHGDDLSRARDIDFTVVFPNALAAEDFAEHFREAGYAASVEFAKAKETHPWDVCIVKHMVPSHADITEFERELEEWADRWAAARMVGDASRSRANTFSDAIPSR